MGLGDGGVKGNDNYTFIHAAFVVKWSNLILNRLV